MAMTPIQYAAQLTQAQKDKIWCQALVAALAPHRIQFMGEKPLETQALHFSRLRFPNTEEFWNCDYTGVSYPTVKVQVPYSKGVQFIAQNNLHQLG